MHSKFDVLVDLRSPSNEVVGLILLHIALPPRLKPLQSAVLFLRLRVGRFPERRVQRYIDLNREIFMWDLILDSSNGFEKCFLVDWLDLGLECSLNEWRNDVGDGRHADLKLDALGDGTLVSQLAKRGIALDCCIVVPGAKTGLLQRRDTLIDLLWREWSVLDRCVVDELCQHGRVGSEDLRLEGGESLSLAWLAIGDAAQAIRQGSCHAAENRLSVRKRHAADEVTATDMGSGPVGMAIRESGHVGAAESESWCVVGKCTEGSQIPDCWVGRRTRGYIQVIVIGDLSVFICDTGGGQADEGNGR